MNSEANKKNYTLTLENISEKSRNILPILSVSFQAAIFAGFLIFLIYAMKIQYIPRIASISSLTAFAILSIVFALIYTMLIGILIMMSSSIPYLIKYRKKQIAENRPNRIIYYMHDNVTAFVFAVFYVFFIFLFFVLLIENSADTDIFLIKSAGSVLGLSLLYFIISFSITLDMPVYVYFIFFLFPIFLLLPLTNIMDVTMNSVGIRKNDVCVVIDKSFISRISPVIGNSKSIHKANILFRGFGSTNLIEINGYIFDVPAKDYTFFYKNTGHSTKDCVRHHTHTSRSHRLLGYGRVLDHSS